MLRTNQGYPHARTLNVKPAAMYCVGFEGFAMQLHHAIFFGLGARSIFACPSDPGSAIVLNSPHASRIYQEIDEITLKQL
jgi:hypothetical protein